MIEAYLYRIRIGQFNASFRIRRVKSKKQYHQMVSRLGKILVLVFSVMVIIPFIDEEYTPLNGEIGKSGKGSHTRSSSMRDFKMQASYNLKWKQLRIYSIKMKPNFRARMLHGNIKKGITNIHLNIRSLYNKMSEVRSLVQKEKPHILGISEAELKKNNHDIRSLKLPGYDLLLPQSWEKDGRARVCVYVKKSLQYEQLQNLQDSDIQTVWLRAGFKNTRKMYFSHLYREHTSTLGSSIASQRKALEKILAQWDNAVVHDSPSKPNEVHIMGDMNLDSMNNRWVQPDYPLISLARLVLQCCSLNNFSQMVDKVTRVQYNSLRKMTNTSCIDHVYCNSKHRISTVRTISIGASDHDAIAYTRFSKDPVSPARTIRKRSYKNFKEAEFLRDMSQLDFTDVYKSKDVDTATDLLNFMLVEVLNAHAPWIIFQQRKHFVPWLTSETRDMMNQRDKLKEQAKALAISEGKNSSAEQTELWSGYKKLRNKVNNRIKQEEVLFKKSKVSECQGCPSKVWGLAKKFMEWASPGPPTQLEVEEQNKITLYTKAKDLARVMNIYFISKVQNIVNGLKKVPENLTGCKGIMAGKELSLSLKFVSVKKVKALLCSLKNKTSSSVDQLDNFAVKLAAPYIAGPLHHVITLSIMQQKFPTSWKFTKIVPLHKKKSALKRENYRPVAILSPLSKVLEKIIYEQINQYFENNGLFHPSLHGYRKSRSTMTALISMYDKWVVAASKGQISGVILVDLSAAFDLVCPALLIKKLQVYGFKKDITNWITSYLTDRYQSVWIDHVFSDFLENSIGVPQGSNLGPLFFLIFFNDLPTFMEENIDCYADDSTLGASGKNVADVGAALSRDCAQLHSWMQSNRFKLNTDKTHFMTVGTSVRLQQVQEDLVVTMDGVTLKESDEKSEELLGITVQCNLKWSKQIESLKRKLSSRLSGLEKLKRIMSRSTKKNIVEGVFNSVLCYCIPLFGGCNKADLNLLQIQQNRAAQCVLNLPPRTSRSVLFDKLGWLTVEQLIAYHTLITVYKIRMKREPEYLAGSLLRDNHYGRIIVKHSNLGLYRNSFVYRGSTLWNKLPRDLRSEMKIGAFKRKLKSWVEFNVERFAT